VVRWRSPPAHRWWEWHIHLEEKTINWASAADRCLPSPAGSEWPARKRLRQGRVILDTVTLCSCMASRWRLRFGVARLISSANTKLQRSARLKLETRRPASSSTIKLVPRCQPHQSGVNWMREKCNLWLGQGAHQQRLAQARHPFQQRVAPSHRVISVCRTNSRWPTMTWPPALR